MRPPTTEASARLVLEKQRTVGADLCTSKEGALVVGVLLFFFLFMIWLSWGCGGDPCGDRGECSSFPIPWSPQCTCTGEYANHTGRFCNAKLGTMILRSEYNNATVQAVHYAGPEPGNGTGK